MERPVITCDVCGRVKGETNHWFLAIAPIDTSDPRSNGIAFGTSAAELEDPRGLIRQHICGQECMHKRLSRWIEASTAPTPTTQESVNA
jgi:hypothetical protein